MPYLSSCNIACGGHVGDKDSIIQTIKLAKKHKVAVGAHPSYPDRENFGRLSMNMAPNELLSSMDEQLDLFYKLCADLDVIVHHIKPHGALYNDMAADSDFSLGILSHWQQKYGDIMVYLLADSKATIAGLTLDLPVKGEVFIDRAYEHKTALVSRSQPGAVISDTLTMAKKLDSYIQSKILDSKGITHQALLETICIHGDHPNATENARFIHQHLSVNEVRIAACR